ncbi:MAG: hypothetical protein HFP81_10760 [Methylococcales symbiont of Hymedesmia sp. n. MRB-2018]|nr:MAG: hypothetical protein HFP81_10760 [Methylococcales symbiont of Hymedesmia sp. n. MRB-2018]
MSPNPYPLFSVSQSDKPEQIKLKTKLLIQLYVKNSSPFVASAVVEHIAALLAYPKYISDIEERCQLRKMEKHWCCLSWIDSQPHLIDI